MNSEKEILMILPRRTILRMPSSSFRFEALEKSKIKAYLEEIQVGQGCWQEAFDFEGVGRPTLIWEIRQTENELEIFEGLISHLALAFDQIPGRYPLYLKLQATNLPYIAKASRMGFIPYFGQWKQSSAQESEMIWQDITDALRKTYPNGFDLNNKIKKD